MKQNEEKTNEGQAKTDSNLLKVTNFIHGKGAEGATALDVAKHLGLIDDKTPKDDFSGILRGVRIVCRKAVDKNNGQRTTHQGRNKVYVIPQIIQEETV